MNLKCLWWQAMALSCVVLEASSEVHSDRYNCTLRGTTLTCDHDLPEEIPGLVTEVYIVDYYHNTIIEQENVFNSPSWQHVQKLDIIVNVGWHFHINDYDFFKLINLTTLGLHSKKIQNIDIYGFAGLQQLVNLDLSDCGRLRSDEIVPALMNKNSTPNLKSLNLKGLRSFNGRLFILSKYFVDMIKKKNIERLSLSGTNILLQDYTMINPDYFIQHLDLSNITFTNVDFSTNMTNGNKQALLAKFVCPNIKTLNMSWMSHRFLIGQMIHFENKDSIVKNRNYCVSNKLEIIDLSYSFGEVSLTNNASIDLSSWDTYIKKIYLRGNNIIKLNCTIHWSKHDNITHVDLSSNKMTYFSANFLNKQYFLTNLLLSNNNLSHMENLPEFRDLLNTFYNLEHFDVSYNKLTHIPPNMFQNNTRLRILDFKGNNLESITFRVEHLLSLKTLELQGNRIKHIDGRVLNELKYILQMVVTDKSTSFELDFRGNPLQCSCSSLDFITWLETTVQPYTHIEYKCALEGETINIDKVAVGQTTYLCHRTGIISAISVAMVVAVATIILIIIVTVNKVKRRKKLNMINTFLADLKNEKLDETHLLFLSFCSDDGDFVLENVYNVLDTNMKELTGFETNIIAHGDADFRPGFSIVSEIMRSISESCVIIFIVSKAFCKSDWCRMEVKEAYEQEKPIILFFRENVEQKLMPRYLLNIFQRYTRAKLEQINGQYELIPSWQCLCESVILLASNKQKQIRQDAQRIEQNQEVEPPANDIELQAIEPAVNGINEPKFGNQGYMPVRIDYI